MTTEEPTIFTFQFGEGYSQINSLPAAFAFSYKLREWMENHDLCYDIAIHRVEGEGDFNGFLCNTAWYELDVTVPTDPEAVLFNLVWGAEEGWETVEEASGAGQ